METTNFEEWLERPNPETPNEIYYLYEAVKNERDEAMWSVLKRDNQLFVTGDNCEHTLLLASDREKQEFLDHIERTFCEGMGIESWYGFRRNLDNPHA
jgi:hypothetical protein